MTRMVPASPMTNAPHQFVPRLREVAISGGFVTVPCSLMVVSSSGRRGWSLLFVLLSWNIQKALR